MSEFGKVFRKINDLSNVDTEGFSSVELKKYHQEIMRLRDLGMKLLDEIEAGQST
jgi:hypothetical protein